MTALTEIQKKNYDELYEFIKDQETNMYLYSKCDSNYFDPGDYSWEIRYGIKRYKTLTKFLQEHLTDIIEGKFNGSVMFPAIVKGHCNYSTYESTLSLVSTKLNSGNTLLEFTLSGEDKEGDVEKDEHCFILTND